MTIACALSTSTIRLLGSVYFTDEGGYEIQKVNGYTFKEFPGRFEMVRLDSKLAVGPGFLIYGGIIDGFQGLQGNVKVKGKFFVTMVDDNQQFILIGFAPEDEWRNFKSLFNKVLKTVKFYISNCSIKFENK